MAAIEAPRLVSLREGYAAFAPTGFLTIVALVGLLQEVMRECQELGLHRLLVDLRSFEHPPLSTTDRYDFGESTAEFWDRSIHLALVARPEQIDPERFGQQVAANRGLFVSVGTDEAEAVAWLVGPKGPEGASAK